ncbi:MAG: transglycosylase SLT domain-containing protein [Gammaproteobacteria bacterium]
MRLLPHGVLLALVLIAATAPAAGAALAQQRQSFQDARNALQAGDLNRFRQLEHALRHYPLYPYLRYYALRRDLAHARADQISHFLQTYDHTPLAPRLRREWLDELARRRDWHEFLRFYRPDQPSRLRCFELQARLHTGRTKGLMKDALKLWLVGHSQSHQCDPVFKDLYASPYINTKTLWERIRLAIREGNLTLASFLGRRLGPRDRHWVELWLKTYRRPARIIRSGALRPDLPITRDIVLYGIGRLARADAAGAQQVWSTVRHRYRFSAAEVDHTERMLALRAAYQDQPQARAWLDALPARAVDTRVREWRVRTALAAQDWKAVVHWIDALGPDQRRDDTWRYWHARALDKIGRHAQARRELADLATERNYHGFLAADRLNWHYAMNDKPIRYTPKELQRLLENHPALVRARELYYRDMNLDARREWYYGTHDLDSRKQALAAVLANQWGWHDQAIWSAAQSGKLDDLALRFPLPYRKQIVTVSRQYGLDPSWVFGVVRQESAFREDARSPAGALGLMQLMPATGRHTARLLNRPRPDRLALLQAEENIRLGAGYLQRMLSRFNGNMVLATAAYNAGPQRVQTWLPAKGSMPADLWVDLIPFRETRGYVRGVLAFTAVFDWRLHGAATHLSRYMPPIPAASP